MGKTGWMAVVVLIVLAVGLAHSETGTQRAINTNQIQLKEHVAGTITRIDGKRLRVLEDVDSMGCATSGVRLVDIIETTKLLRRGAVIAETDLQNGDRVLIEATVRGDILEATEIRIEDLSSTEHKR